MQPTYRPIRTGGPGFSITTLCLLAVLAIGAVAYVYWKRGGLATTARTAAPPPAANTNNNPIARSAKILGTVQALNQEGEKTADAIQTSAKPSEEPLSATPVAAAVPSPHKLQAIFYGKNPTALINNKSVKVGDEIDGAKIVAITQKSVRIQNGADTRELSLK